MPLERFHLGAKHEVLVYTVPSGRSPVDEFLESMPARDRDRMLALISYSADYGPPRNREKCHQVESFRFFEFKTHHHRLIWRWTHDNRIVLMHGFAKQRERIAQADLDVATQRY